MMPPAGSQDQGGAGDALQLATWFVPAQEKRSKRLMIVLHGLGDSHEGYQWLPDELGITDLNYLLVDAPDEYYGGYSWYDYLGDMRPGVDRSIRAIHRLLNEQRVAGFPSEQTYLFGFSQGCLMTLEAGLRYGHVLAGLIGISGYLPDHQKLLSELSPVARSQRILVTHGTRDPVLPFRLSLMHMKALQDAGLKLSWHEYPKVHNIHGQEEIRVIRDFIQSQAVPG